MTAAPTRRGWLVVNLVAQLAFGLLAMTICLPSMQDWPSAFGASQAAVQLTFSGYVAAYGGLQLVYGAMSDRIGRKPVLLTGLTLAIAGSLLAAASTSLWMLTAARVLQGAGTAAGMVIGRAMVQDLFSGPERTRVMAFVGMSMGMCPPLAMIIGGLVHVRLGWQANFVGMAALGVALFVAAWRWLPAPTPRKEAPAPARELLAGYMKLLRDPVFMLYVAILSMTSATFYAFLGGAPLVLARYGVSPERMGLFIMCIPLSYIAGNVVAMRLIGRMPDARLMLLGHLLTVTGVVVVLALGLAGLRVPLALCLPLVLLGIGHGLLVPPTLAGTVGLVPALAGSAAAVAGLMQQMTGAFGGFAVGLMPEVGSVSLSLQMLGWAGCGLAAQLWLARRHAVLHLR